MCIASDVAELCGPATNCVAGCYRGRTCFLFEARSLSYVARLNFWSDELSPAGERFQTRVGESAGSDADVQCHLKTSSASLRQRIWVSGWVGAGWFWTPSLGPKHIASFCNSLLTHPTAPRVQAWRIRSIGWLDIFPSGWHEKDPIRRGCPKFWIASTLAGRWLSV